MLEKFYTYFRCASNSTYADRPLLAIIIALCQRTPSLLPEETVGNAPPKLVRLAYALGVHLFVLVQRSASPNCISEIAAELLSTKSGFTNPTCAAAATFAGGACVSFSFRCFSSDIADDCGPLGRDLTVARRAGINGRQVTLTELSSH